MYLVNATSGEVIAEHVREAVGPLARMVGLLTRANVGPSEGLWLGDCPAVHTFGMRAVIDLIFLDRGGCVVGTVARAERNRPFYSCRNAKTIVELGAGSRLELARPGDVLELHSADPRLEKAGAA